MIFVCKHLSQSNFVSFHDHWSIENEKKGEEKRQFNSGVVSVFCTKKVLWQISENVFGNLSSQRKFKTD